MEHSHFSRLLYPLVLGPLLGIDRSSVAILATPMYHNGTWTTMLPALYAGGTVVIAQHFSPQDFQATVARERCTHAFMVPTQLILLAADPKFDPRALASMKTIMISGAPLPPETLETMRSALGHVEICEIYGMGEGFMTLASNRGGIASVPGSVGRPIAEVDTDIRIIDDEDRLVPLGGVGEIVGTSSFMLKGYYGEPELTRQALWFGQAGRAYLRSGDLGYFDESGFLHLAGRKKDMIISGGVKVYATDLEQVFISHPEVLEVAAIAIPHEKWGETPLLLAIMKPSAHVSEDELKEWGNKQLGKAQRVSRVEFRSSFPRNALDKIVKRHLREPYWTKPP
jgi:acyl-CoA synthetase (AMP-forming)/AMP-acid ligase II